MSDAFVREMAAFDDEKTKLMAKNLKSQQKKFSQVRSVVSLCSKCTRSMTFENLQQAEAEKEGMVLRYVGSVDLANKKCEVKLAKYPKTHPFAGTQYADNIVACVLHCTVYAYYIRLILYFLITGMPTTLSPFPPSATCRSRW